MYLDRNGHAVISNIANALSVVVVCELAYHLSASLTAQNAIQESG
jgi:hypothetical protein